MKTKLFIAFILAAFAVVPAKAQIRERKVNQRHRIEQGVKSGELTRGERHRLAAEQKDIRQDIRRAKNNDGHIGPKERRHIRRDENRASRDIYRAKHNKRERF